MMTVSQTKQALSWSCPTCLSVPCWHQVSPFHPSSHLEMDGVSSRSILCAYCKEHPPTEPGGIKMGPKDLCHLTHLQMLNLLLLLIQCLYSDSVGFLQGIRELSGHLLCQGHDDFLFGMVLVHQKLHMFFELLDMAVSQSHYLLQFLLFLFKNFQSTCHLCNLSHFVAHQLQPVLLFCCSEIHARYSLLLLGCLQSFVQKFDQLLEGECKTITSLCCPGQWLYGQRRPKSEISWYWLLSEGKQCGNLETKVTSQWEILLSELGPKGLYDCSQMIWCRLLAEKLLPTAWTLAFPPSFLGS